MPSCISDCQIRPLEMHQRQAPGQARQWLASSLAGAQVPHRCAAPRRGNGDGDALGYDYDRQQPPKPAKKFGKKPAQ